MQHLTKDSSCPLRGNRFGPDLNHPRPYGCNPVQNWHAAQFVILDGLRFNALLKLLQEFPGCSAPCNRTSKNLDLVEIFNRFMLLINAPPGINIPPKFYYWRVVFSGCPKKPAAVHSAAVPGSGSGSGSRSGSHSI